MLGLQAGRTCLSSAPPPPSPSSRAVDILCVGPKPVQQRYSGVIRVQDVRATEIDKVGSGGVTCGCWPATARNVEGCWGRVGITGSPGCTPTHPPTHPPPLSPFLSAPGLRCLQVQIQASFRPGDVVRAEVLSLGDARSYHLTTAKNELGVVYAKSVAGVCWG